jgi:RNase H-fold protein (predicted Holliday junction resolvase)
VKSIDSRHNGAEVGVATENGKTYYRIVSLLAKIGIRYSDVILGERRRHPPLEDLRAGNLFDEPKLIITSRKERLRLASGHVVCIEDLGDDTAVAKQRLLSMMYPPKDSDQFIVGIDPGERTGLVAFLNHIEIEGTVLGSVKATICRVFELLDNTSTNRKIVRIGSGIPMLADRIAKDLSSRYDSRLRIQIVDERGTSIASRSHHRNGAKDQISAQLIAFREGTDYVNRCE